MVISLREACSCIGLSGNNISILHDFFGYDSVPAPFNGTTNCPQDAPGIEILSLYQQVRLIKNNLHIRLHIKEVRPAGFFVPVGRNPTIDQQVSAMRQVFAGMGIAIIIRSKEILTLPDEFIDIHVGYCQKGDASGEVISLFQNLNSVPTSTVQYSNFYDEYAHETATRLIWYEHEYTYSTEIVLYFVSTVTYTNPQAQDAPLGGCAAYPSGVVVLKKEEPRGEFFYRKEKTLLIPGAVIASNSGIWVIAHEIGHVLGLNHIEKPCPGPLSPDCQGNSLMTCCSPCSMTNPPPDVSAEEASKIYSTSSRLSIFKKCGDP